jgi:mannose-6-phosphate isomerase-like protein (cupin superfamily)
MAAASCNQNPAVLLQEPDDFADFHVPWTFLRSCTALQSAARFGKWICPQRIQGAPSMSLTIRRVVTGHDQQGRAIVAVDETAKNVVETRPGAQAAVIWTTEGFPVDNDDDLDASTRKVGTTLANGSVFRVVSFGPGVAPRNHRTDSIDYAVVISGEIDMELDEGKSVHLKAGDVMVQRGTIHNWVNRGTAPCVIAFTLIAAKPVTAGGKTLAAVG